jgi:hypothetical protein
MSLSAYAMPVSEREMPRASSTPLPKINVPPPREVEREVSTEPADFSTRHVKQGVANSSASRLSQGSAIRWDARFALSLIILLVVVNFTLVLLFAKPATNEKGFVTELAPATAQVAPAPGLNSLAPAGGQMAARERATTTYISTTERKALLDQLRRTPQPGVVSVPAIRSPDTAH